MHQWRPLERSLADLAGGESNLVLLIRGELLRRYPNTVVLADPRDRAGHPEHRRHVSSRPIFAGYLEPDISFFGFDLTEEAT